MNRKVWLYVGVISTITFFVLLICVSIFLNSPKEEKIKKLDGGDISLTYTDDINGLSMTNLRLISDAVGMKLDSADMFFDFSVATDLTEANEIDYEISIKKDTNYSTTIDENIRAYLEKQKGTNFVKVFGPETYEPLVKSNGLTKKGYMPVYKEKVTTSGIDNYRLRVWVSDKAKIPKGAKQNITMKVYVNGKAK